MENRVVYNAVAGVLAAVYVAVYNTSAEVPAAVYLAESLERFFFVYCRCCCQSQACVHSCADLGVTATFAMAAWTAKHAT